MKNSLFLLVSAYIKPVLVGKFVFEVHFTLYNHFLSLNHEEKLLKTSKYPFQNSTFDEKNRFFHRFFIYNTNLIEKVVFASILPFIIVFFSLNHQETILETSKYPFSEVKSSRKNIFFMLYLIYKTNLR